MFSLENGLPFAAPTTPAPLRESFEALLATLGEVAGGIRPGLFVEVFWAALHGLATLTRAGRLPAEMTEQRVAVLVDHFVDPVTS